MLIYISETEGMGTPSLMQNSLLNESHDKNYEILDIVQNGRGASVKPIFSSNLSMDMWLGVGWRGGAHWALM